MHALIIYISVYAYLLKLSLVLRMFCYEHIYIYICTHMFAYYSPRIHLHIAAQIKMTSRRDVTGMMVRIGVTIPK